MVNRFLSMNPQQAMFVNMIQKYQQLPIEMHYRFFQSLLPKRKQYNKYIKATKKDKNPIAVKVLTTHYNVSSVEAEGYLDILMSDPHGVVFLKELAARYGKEL